MAENVKVIVRCRPMNDKERNMRCKNIAKVDKCVVSLGNPSDLTAPSKEFTFDSAYDSRTSTEAIYNDICYGLVENVLEGYNGTIFAYGQTGCGKSHTMQGPDIPPDLILTNEQMSQRGIIPRSFDHIFEAISVTTGVRFLPLVSYLEIYNENIRDLLNPTTPSSTLILKEQPNEGIVVQNLSSHAVHTAEECEQLLTIGTKNRMVGATLMNAGSSRSHSIFIINVEQITTSNGNSCSTEEMATIKKGKLNLVDLAGSERQNKTGATGDRLKEATKINLSLSALGNVISALVDGKSKHIPYRDSKLTRLLQDSLGGNTKTLMVACISPADYNYDETLSTLRYASRAKNISNKPTVNEDPKDAMLREYQAEISKLKDMLQSNTTQSPASSISDDSETRAHVEEEKIRLQEFYENETERLKREHENQRREKEELMQDLNALKAQYQAKLTEVETTNRTRDNDKAEVINKIRALKSSLVGGECANDDQLKEKRKRKKLAAQQRIQAMQEALSLVDHDETRDILHAHYSDIQHELKAKTDALKAQTRKVNALEREVNDLQSEFQLDRTDYLETIRKLEMNLKFYQQFVEMSLPYLRKSGRSWDPEAIKSESIWCEDLNKWKLPEHSMIRLKLPPAEYPKTLRIDDLENSDIHTHNFEADIVLEKLDQEHEKKQERSDSNNILGTYFRPRRAAELINQNKVLNCWKDYSSRPKPLNNWLSPTQNIPTSGQAWQTKSSSAVLQLNGKHSLWTTPTINGNDTNEKPFLFKSGNYPITLTEQDNRMLNVFRKTKAMNSSLRDITLQNGNL